MRVLTLSDLREEAPRTYPRGRRCRVCGTVMSIYNGNDGTCWLHSVVTDREVAVEDLAELMSEPGIAV